MYKIFISLKQVAQCDTLQETYNLVSAYLRLMANEELAFGPIDIQIGSRTLRIRETTDSIAFNTYVENLTEADMVIMEKEQKTNIGIGQ